MGFGVQVDGFTPRQLGEFRRHQRASFDVLERIHDGLRVGDTEEAVARRLRAAFHRQGVHRYFHVPVALFGERTAYPGDFGALGALPTDTRLERDMPVILDAAPVYGGYTVDTSLARPFGDNATQDELLATLRPLRDDIHRRVQQRETFQQIAHAVDTQVRAAGLENCHRKHIGAVLGHRVTRVDSSWLSHRRAWGLAVQPVGWFLLRSIRSRGGGDDQSPNWNHGRASAHPPTPGLWAVEPHVARAGVGAKFEELLLIQADTVEWLDDDLPHHRA